MFDTPLYQGASMLPGLVRHVAQHPLGRKLLGGLAGGPLGMAAMLPNMSVQGNPSATDAMMSKQPTPPTPNGYVGQGFDTGRYYPGVMQQGSPGSMQPPPQPPAPPLPAPTNVGYAPGASPQAMAMPPIGAPGALPLNGYDNNGNSTAPTPSMSPLIQQFIQRLMAKS